MNRAKLVTIVLALVGAVATAEAANLNPCPPSGARVFVSATGSITLNGSTVALADLARAVANLKPRPTVLCYARENPEQQPHPQALAALEALMGANLPIALFKDSAFTQGLGN